MSETARVKYPRTPHLPGSGRVASDDLRVGASHLAGRDVVVTEKLDGQNVTLYTDGLHARSLDSEHHPSQNWLRAMHAQISADIPSNMRVCGESMFAVHAIEYQNLESYFYGFSVWENDICLDWDSAIEWLQLLGLVHVPVLYRGPMPSVSELVTAWRAQCEAPSEGFVVRSEGSFGRDEFGDHVAKWVSDEFKPGNEHWTRHSIRKNGLRGGQS